jgi:hypothetical protein
MDAGRPVRPRSEPVLSTAEGADSSAGTKISSDEATKERSNPRASHFVTLVAWCENN